MGCGAIMRIAPIGLVAKGGEPSAATYVAPNAYTLACESARSTHGHPMSTFSSGFFALLVAQLMKGTSLAGAITESKRSLEHEAGALDLLAVINEAEQLARSDAPPIPETVERLGAGWVAEEALALSLFCALRAESFEHGVRLAVNHGGDSDSTGSLTGRLLGTLSGAAIIPKRWLDEVELREIIEAISVDLVAVYEHGKSTGDREYPGW